MSLLILHNCNLIDLEEQICRPNCSIVINNQLIEHVGFASDLSESFIRNNKTYLLDNKYIAPGFIDSHVHIFEEPDGALYEDFRIDEDLDIALNRGIKHLDIILRAGITAVREMGTIERRNVTLRNLVAKEANKPELIVSGNPLTHTDGHFVSRCRIVDNEIQMQQAVEDEINAGADFIKINNSIRVGMSQKIIEAAVKTAEKLGSFVACHSYTYDAMKVAIAAGVKTLEHIAEFDEDLLRNIQEKEIIAIPTFVAAYDSIPSVNPNAEMEILIETIPDASMKDFVDWYNWQIKNLPLLFSSNVEFGIGTDSGFIPTTFDSLHKEMNLLCKLGATPWQVLKAATIGSSKALGKEKEMGLIKKGMLANLVVLNQNPILDISNSKSIYGTVLRGRFIQIDGELD